MPRKPREQVILSQIAELQAELRELKRNERWKCNHCQKKSRIRDLVLLDVKPDISPYVLVNGRQFDGYFAVECPKCLTRHHLDRGWVITRIDYFHSTEEKKDHA